MVGFGNLLGSLVVVKRVTGGSILTVRVRVVHRQNSQVLHLFFFLSRELDHLCVEYQMHSCDCRTPRSLFAVPKAQVLHGRQLVVSLLE